jgi:methyl acetate hydrolase
MPSTAGIDAALRHAVAAGEVPGVAAVAATDRGILYEGTFGDRDLAAGTEMTIDTVLRIASMTKAVTSVAAMQLVERGKLGLDDPIGHILPELAAPQVLEGFDAAGRPRLRPAVRPITLRRLLNHTAGFGYEMLSADLARFIRYTGIPSTRSGLLASLQLPLLFDPGERWEYGISTDWVGRAVEAVSGVPLDRYFGEHICRPLGMSDTIFSLSPTQRLRLARVHQRQADGSLTPIGIDLPPHNPEYWGGGDGLYSTALDFLTFLRMVLGAGRCGPVQVLRPATIALMAANQTGGLEAGVMRAPTGEVTHDLTFFPQMRCHWGLAWMISPQPSPNGRNAGSLSWGGAFNSYYWIDPRQRVTAVIMTQFLPFADRHALALYGAFERAVYEALGAA